MLSGKFVKFKPEPCMIFVISPTDELPRAPVQRAYGRIGGVCVRWKSLVVSRPPFPFLIDRVRQPAHRAGNLGRSLQIVEERYPFRNECYWPSPRSEPEESDRGLKRLGNRWKLDVMHLVLVISIAHQILIYVVYMRPRTVCSGHGSKCQSSSGSNFTGE